MTKRILIQDLEGNIQYKATVNDDFAELVKYMVKFSLQVITSQATEDKKNSYK